MTERYDYGPLMGLVYADGGAWCWQLRDSDLRDAGDAASAAAARHALDGAALARLRRLRDDIDQALARLERQPDPDAQGDAADPDE